MRNVIQAFQLSAAFVALHLEDEDRSALITVVESREQQEGVTTTKLAFKLL